MERNSQHLLSWQTENPVIRFVPTDILCAHCTLLFNDVVTFTGELGPPWQKTASITGMKNQSAFLAPHRDGRLRTLRQEMGTCATCQTLASYVSEQLECYGTRWYSLDDAHYRLVFEPERESGMEIHLQVGPSAPPPIDSEEKWISRRFKYDLYMQDNPNDPYWEQDGLFQVRPTTVSWPHMQTRLHSYFASEESFDLAKLWLRSCNTLELHPHCVRKTSKLPKRVIDIGITSPPDCVCLQRGDGRLEHYITLSYSWGLSPPLRTTHANIEKHFEGIPFTELPHTLRDAVLVTSRLGYRYIWIDALCIVQDDKQDWGEHGPKMARIYRNSALTISATSSADCDSGILKCTKNYGVEIGSYRHDTDREYRRPVFFDQRRRFSIYDQQLFNRGWAFQEQLVSPAVLHYTDNGMAWSCFTCYSDQWHRAEGDLFNMQWLQQNTLYASIADAKQLEMQQQNTVLLTNKTKEAYATWYSWVSIFSNRELTFVADKLPAMAGVAAHFATNMRTTYLAGLWKENFVSDLLWERANDAKSLIKHPEIVPSWSWASITGPIWHELCWFAPTSSRYDLVIWSVDVKEDLPESFGRVADARITADGWLQQVRLARLNFLDVRVSHEHSAESGFVKGITVVCKLDQLEEDSIEAVWCWALRIGLFVPLRGGYPIIIMLLLESVGLDNSFKRIGLAYTLAAEKGGGPLREDICESGTWQRVVLV